MNITFVEYSGTFPDPITGQWEKILLHGDLVEGDDYRACLYDLKKKAQSFHFESSKAAEKQAEKSKDVGSSLIDQINSCTDLKVLDSYKLIAKSRPEIQEAYDNKKKELSETK